MFKNRFIAIITAFSLLLILSALSAYCQDDSPIKTIDGRIVSVDPQNSQVVVKASEVFIFFVPSAAKVTGEDGLDIQLSALNIGSYVMVEYYDDHSGAHIARNISAEYKK